ncbi:hypothetical protein NA57DRAFT_80592 [Rhizodiscina lignyota]|uniref:Uncharacterized protein n=1 Tax=Rhizodiscina lignyota TaxID=1504668 RepID=A0A9P4I345_9PEZI|nr:hypothetical protein NA57DRAFT_80592 [Rhizodiscina lignyota]
MTRYHNRRKVQHTTSASSAGAGGISSSSTEKPVASSTAGPSNSNRFPFLKLPAELRLQIYDCVFECYLFDEYRPLGKWYTSGPSLRIIPAKRQSFFKLFHINHQTRGEIMAHILSTYIIEIFHDQLIGVLQLFGPTERTWIKHLRILALIDENFMREEQLQKLVRGTDVKHHPQNFRAQLDTAVCGLKDIISGPFSLPNLSTLAIHPDLDIWSISWAAKSCMPQDMRWPVLDALEDVSKLEEFKIKEFKFELDREHWYRHDQPYAKCVLSLFHGTEAVVVAQTQANKAMENDEDNKAQA